MVWLPRSKMQTYRLNSRAQMWPSDSTLTMTLTLNIQSQIWNLLNLSQKWSDCHGTNNKHINWTLGLKCDHQIWSWPWPWPWIFKVKYRICHISAKNGPIAMKRKANMSIELKASNVTIRFDLSHDLDLQFSWSNMKFAISQPKELQASNVTNGFDLVYHLDIWMMKVKYDLDLWRHTWPWPCILMVKFWNSCISKWEGWLTLHKGYGSMSFMTMTMTIWWPRSGVWIHQIVTGVTSVVGMPSTHLVCVWVNGSTWNLYLFPPNCWWQFVWACEKLIRAGIFCTWIVGEDPARAGDLNTTFNAPRCSVQDGKMSTSM